MSKKIAILFKNLCCSICKSDFDENSVEIIRREDSMLVIRLVCQHCQKSFGVAFLGVDELDVKEQICDDDLPLEVNSGAPAISVDDVLDAHKFIQNLDEHWLQYLPKN